MGNKYKQQFADFKNTLNYALEIAKLQVVTSINEIATKSNISQKDIAKKMKVSEAQVSKIMRADQNLTLRTLVKLSRALDADLSISFKPSHQKEEELEKFIREVTSIRSKARPSRRRSTSGGHDFITCMNQDSDHAVVQYEASNDAPAAA